VTLDLTVEAPRADAMAQKITALTSGSARIEVRAEDYFPIQAP